MIERDRTVGPSQETPRTLVSQWGQFCTRAERPQAMLGRLKCAQTPVSKGLGVHGATGVDRSMREPYSQQGKRRTGGCIGATEPAPLGAGDAHLIRADYARTAEEDHWSPSCLCCDGSRSARRAIEIAGQTLGGGRRSRYPSGSPSAP
jgi:hypothetical protein